MSSSEYLDDFKGFIQIDTSINILLDQVSHIVHTDAIYWTDTINWSMDTINRSLRRYDQSTNGHDQSVSTEKNCII
jgi:hypothetical protein